MNRWCQKFNHKCSQQRKMKHLFKNRESNLEPFIEIKHSFFIDSYSSKAILTLTLKMYSLLEAWRL